MRSGTNFNVISRDGTVLIEKSVVKLCVVDTPVKGFYPVGLI